MPNKNRPFLLMEMNRFFTTLFVLQNILLQHLKTQTPPPLKRIFFRSWSRFYTMLVVLLFLNLVEMWVKDFCPKFLFGLILCLMRWFPDL